MSNLQKHELKEATGQGQLLRDVTAETRNLIEEARNRDFKGETLVCCRLSKEMLQEFQDRVVLSYYPGGVSEAVTDLIRAAVLKKRPKTKDPFYDGPRHFGIPRSCFILTTLPPAEWAKLKEWRDKNEDVCACTGSDLEIILMNQTRLDKWSQNKQKEAEESCPVS